MPASRWAATDSQSIHGYRFHSDPSRFGECRPVEHEIAEVGMSIQAPDVGLTEFHQYLIRCRDPRVSGGRARRPFLCAVQNAENVDSITGDSIVLQHIRNDRLYGNCGCEQLGCKLTMWPRFSSSIAELESINRTTRWDYQRDHFYIRTPQDRGTADRFE